MTYNMEDSFVRYFKDYEKEGAFRQCLGETKLLHNSELCFQFYKIGIRSLN